MLSHDHEDGRIFSVVFFSAASAYYSTFLLSAVLFSPVPSCALEKLCLEFFSFDWWVYAVSLYIRSTDSRWFVSNIRV